MNKIAPIFALALISAVGNAEGTLRQQIQKKYDRIAQISMTDITKAIPETAKMLTSDFTWIDPSGNEYSVEPYLGSQSRNITAVSKVFAAKNVILSYKEDGIYVRCRIKSSLTYRRTGFSADQHLGMSISDDIWVKTIHGWKMYKSIGIRDSDTIVRRGDFRQSAAVMTARMTSAGVVQPAAALAFPSSSIVR